MFARAQSHPKSHRAPAARDAEKRETTRAEGATRDVEASARAARDDRGRRRRDDAMGERRATTSYGAWGGDVEDVGARDSRRGGGWRETRTRASEGGGRDQFLTSAMLCVGAVSVCIVSVMIAGGLAFVGLSENHAERGMDFVRNGNDAWTTSGGYGAGGDGGSTLYASRGGANARGRFDYFAQPDRIDQDRLVDELDRRYGARLQAMMRELRGETTDGFSTLTMTRGEDPSYLPPAPMTEQEREMNEAAEQLRRLPNERLPSVDDDGDADTTTTTGQSHHLHKHHHHHRSSVLATEEAEYEKLKLPAHVVVKARERFEQFENTQEWHAKIRQDADKYVERLEEIYGLIKKSKHHGAKSEIKLGVEAVRQWHATIARDLKTKLAVMEVGLEKIADAKSRDPETHVSALSEDINDELQALTTTMDRVDNLRDVLGKLLRVLTEEDEDVAGAGTAEDLASAEPSYDLASTAPSHEEVMKKWNNVAKEWVKPNGELNTGRDSGVAHVSARNRSGDEKFDDALDESDDAAQVPDWVSKTRANVEKVTTGAISDAVSAKDAPGGDAPWVHSRARLGSSMEFSAPAHLGVNVLPSDTLADVLTQIVDLVLNVTEALDGTRFDFNGTRLNITVDVNETAAETALGPDAAALGEMLQSEVADAVTAQLRDKRLAYEASLGEKPTTTKTPTRFAALGSSWGSNEWTGTDAADASWDPLRGEDDGVYVDDASTRLDWTIPPGGDSRLSSSQPNGDGEDEELAPTPTPADEHFQSKSKKKIVEEFAKAEHKSAEAWRQEALKAQQKLEEVAAKGMENDADLQKSAGAVEKLKGLVKEFKKALLKESTARAKAERLLEEETTRAAEEQEDTEKRVVEQAKLQILAARTEARDASLARIKAEEEAEKAIKEKIALAKAAAKVQRSADEALRSVLADKEDAVAQKKSKIEETAPRPDGTVDAVSDDVLDAATEAAHVDTDATITPPAKRKPKVTTWDSALKDIARDASDDEDEDDEEASAGAPKSKPSARSAKNDDDDDDAKSSSSSSATKPVFTATIAVKSYDVSKKDMKLLRGAFLSLLRAKAPGACDDAELTLTKRVVYDGSVKVDVRCANVPSVDHLTEANDAMNWAFVASRKFPDNLVKIGFRSASADDVTLDSH